MPDSVKLDNYGPKLWDTIVVGHDVASRGPRRFGIEGSIFLRNLRNRLSCDKRSLARSTGSSANTTVKSSRHAQFTARTVQAFYRQDVG
jgi:hypothetical protein